MNAKMNIEEWFSLAAIIIILAVIVAFSVGALPFKRAMATGQTQCPTSAGWTKVDSSDLSAYPVSGATQYCFKAGSDNSQGCTGGLFDAIPEGGFVQPYCGLSHWAYYIPASVSPTPTATPSATPTPTPGDDVTPTLTPTPTQPPVITGGPGDGLSDGRSDGRSSCPSCTQPPKVEPVTFAGTGRGMGTAMGIVGIVGAVLTVCGIALIL